MMRENKDILKERLSFLDEEVEENRSEINYLETLIEKLDKKAPKVLDYCKGEGFVETDKLGRIVVKDKKAFEKFNAAYLADINKQKVEYLKQVRKLENANEECAKTKEHLTNVLKTKYSSKREERTK